MKRVARTLEASLAAHSPSAGPDIPDQRRQQVRQLPGLINRSMVSAVDLLAERQPKAAATALNGLAFALGRTRYLGNGAWASVYRTGDEVVKVYRHTAIMSEPERESFLKSRAEMCDELCKQMGVQALGQVFGIDEHPLGDYRVVTARQPYVEGVSLDLFTTNTFDLHEDEIADYCERQPAAKSELSTLVESTFISNEAISMVPDLNGNDNFRLVGANESLCLIDAEPVRHSDYPGVHDMIMRQAEVLGRFLSIA